MVKRTQTIRRLFPTNFLSKFEHFVGLALKGLKGNNNAISPFTSNVWFSCNKFGIAFRPKISVLAD